jgi:hypothetical protein
VKVILRSTDLSFIQSAQIALDAHDIPTTLSSDNTTGLPSSASTLAVLDDEDFDRASAVLRELKRTPPPPWWEASWAPRALLLVIIILMLFVCGTLIF